MTRPRIMILGAGGFIGRQLAQSLAARGIEVVAATRRPTNFEHPDISNEVCTYLEVDQFASLLVQCTAVIHAASVSTPGSSAARPQLDGNLRTTLALIEALQQTPRCRLLYLSSAGTLYGNREDSAREDDPLRPHSYHGAGKAAAEQFIHAWTAQYQGTAVVLRPSNVYGQGQEARDGFAIIPTALECVRRNKPLTLWGDGRAVRDYLHIEDFLALCHASLEAPMQHGSHVFNASSNCGISLDTLIDKIDEVTGIPLQRVHQPARIVDILSITADNKAAREAFSWTPSISLDEGLRRTWKWFSTQA